jgi:hypothetical protein
MTLRSHLRVIDGGRSIFDEILIGPFRPSAAPVVVCNGCAAANQKLPDDQSCNVTELFHGSTTTTKPEN